MTENQMRELRATFIVAEKTTLVCLESKPELLVSLLQAAPLHLLTE
jgi:hypothetical protein